MSISMLRNYSSNYVRGLIAELYALIYFFCKGYRICAWRYKTPVGEVDLIVSRGDNLVFVEVKRRPDLITALESITPQMRYRIARAAHHFLTGFTRKAGDWQGNMRFDVVAVSGWRLRHLDNAWLAAT